MRTIFRLLLCVLLAVPVTGAAPNRTANPKILELITESGPTFGGLQALLLQLRATRTLDENWLAGDLVTGELNRTAAIFEHDSYSSLQGTNAAIHAAWERLAPGRRPRLDSRVFEFAPEQSYNNGHVPWSEARAASLFLVQINAGSNDAYKEQQRVAAQYLTKEGVRDEEWLGYELKFGSEAPAYLFVTPMRDVSDLDLPPENRGQILPDDVDRLRNAVLLKSVRSSSLLLLTIRRDLSSP